ncbi:ABC transporter ATP-binding protein [Citrobacter koseri]|uniref:ABC transporter ATP-binding protein n=1 Tax=Citrobacter koseri TaxID=545 RepID=A0A2X2V5C2_CITKO|nr:ABC transporter ATP-binding protein [Citrobacter koseri]
MSSPQENNRKLLQRALKLPQVSDGMIQGKSVRLILKKEATAEDIRRAEGMPEITINDTTPRFEDAFIDLLGGAGTSESPLGAILHTVDGTPGETVIEAKELTKKFGDFAATDHVNFAVERGEIFGLLGPNGAGKSTTFKMMCGLLVPTSGKALVLDMDLKVSSGKARQHLGYMAQKFFPVRQPDGRAKPALFLRGLWPAGPGAKRKNHPHERSLRPEKASPLMRRMRCRSVLNSVWRWPVR